MAKTDNLTDFLTGVAGAIRSKKGTTALIDPQDFESEIESIDTAKPEQTKTLTVTENGTQSVAPDSGKVLSAVTVVTNVLATPTEEKSVDLAMASGDQVVTPTSGKNLTKVTVKKPATLIASNIKSGVTIGGVAGSLSPAKTEQAKTADLAMASGDQTISPDSGKVLSSVKITKPSTLIASNIKKSVDIGGVVGTYAPSTETKTVALSMGSGNQVILKTSGKDGMTQVTVTKPVTMLPANIKKGVNIGGVTGTYEGESSGGGSEEVWTLDRKELNAVDPNDYSWSDQPFYFKNANGDKQWAYFAMRALYLIAYTTSAPASQISVQAASEIFTVGGIDSSTDEFVYNEDLEDIYKKIVFPKPATGTLLTLLQAIAIKQPTDYAIQGLNSKAYKRVTITSNGTVNITPDVPYDAMKNVQVTVNVGSDRYTQEASVKINANYSGIVYLAFTRLNKNVAAAAFNNSAIVKTYVGETITIQTGLTSVKASGTGILFSNNTTSYSGGKELLIFIITDANATLTIEDNS